MVDLASPEARERMVWALFKATFHPDEDEALMREKWIDWADEQHQHYRKADAALAEVAAMLKEDGDAH